MTYEPTTIGPMPNMNIESAFLKDDSAIYNVQFRTERNIKIKIEVEVN